jgi:hypothetical protein
MTTKYQSIAPQFFFFLSSQGYQKTTVSNDTLCVLKGIIVSAKLYNLKNTIIGSPGARPRFSGGIVASRCTGYVIGICRRPPPMGFNMGPYVGNTDLAEYVEIINIALIVSAIHYHVAIKRLDALTYVV